MEELVVRYNGIDITYVETDDRWEFELRGRERSAESLAKAKEAIDKPVADKKDSFTRVPAYKTSNYSWDSSMIRVEVTSLTEPHYGNQQAWISANGKREKVYIARLYAVTPENDTKIAELSKLRAQRDEISSKMRALHESLTKILITE